MLAVGGGAGGGVSHPASSAIAAMAAITSPRLQAPRRSWKAAVTA
jgi:hypothetical protein